MDPEYPTEKDLKHIENYPIKNDDDYLTLAKIIELTWNSDYGTVNLERVEENELGDPVFELTLITGGWSGNESIISAIHKNMLFQTKCWKVSERGGLFLYEIPVTNK